MTQSQQPSANAPAPRTAADYQAQLDEKRARLTELFAGFTLPALEVHSSPAEYYRMRAEFRIWHEGDDLFHCMYAPATKEIIKIDHFPTASRLINQLMPLLLEGLRPHPVLRRKLFQIDYLSTQSGQIIVSLLYHRKLEAEWQQAAEALQADLRAKGFELQLIGRAHKQKICLGDDFVIEQLNVAGRQLIYKQVENSFTQPNATINEQMLAWALDVTKGSEGDLLELYCGNGNFSIALAQNFRKVLATEIAKPSVDSAQFNIAANGVDNLIILRMSAEEFTMAMRGEREFNRLKGVDLKSYQCNTIFVDPPRAGLDDATVKLVQEYDNILYISCNPETLQANMAVLGETHEIARFALFDQFPWTHHMEAGVYLRRKAG
ncbi:tRNA (uridine(54)-C5)-methyltransferase TrmA [Aeromonas veronii]|uniref:tRNA (uridine(54)-C5)-methyltransferase TrmA n=1 Tax=Aeromonas veronii TaxID=654 RepID=UPI000206A7C5|nr:tRNA (uridine(54)-C5)-methyltransferase TrmA [Aeromonas veronii]AEB48151.1 tRNA (uracil-5-)-methyltransferase [Aeromonas veronii B565]EKB10612.1 tRNA (uracil-5-)-methyltransferase [Aeromonas veronii AER397]MBS4692439.1 tRNA (uridine(54)-C5)-methyltransferase TrmA [Aeromonas veronii bv. veronii]OKP36093.1 tRNA (uridine(54)-C5)-methyltransferase TrmA [Aeromonas veronii bv. veronii]